MVSQKMCGFYWATLYMCVNVVSADVGGRRCCNSRHGYKTETLFTGRCSSTRQPRCQHATLGTDFSASCTSKSTSTETEAEVENTEYCTSERCTSQCCASQCCTSDIWAQTAVTRTADNLPGYRLNTTSP